jgi:hypothetical protein
MPIRANLPVYPASSRVSGGGLSPGIRYWARVAIGFLLSIEGNIRYTEKVYIDIRFNSAAFKHGISENDIRFAMLNALYDDVLDDIGDKHLVLGFDRSGNLLEVLYNIIDEDSINVFHAMNCRSIFFSLTGRFRRNVWRE